MNSTKIEEYADALERLEMLKQNLETLREKVVPPEVHQALKELDEEYHPMIEAAEKHLEQIKEEVVSEVLQSAATIKGSRWMAIWNKGKETWDGAKLRGYAMAHPEIMEARKVGAPTVSFRRVL
jgi:hypothetical protein